MRILARFCLAFAAAVALAQYLPDSSVAVAVLAALGLIAVLLHRSGARSACAALILSGILCGVTYHLAYVAIVRSPMLLFSGREETLLMEVCDYPRETERGSKVTVRILSPNFKGKAMYYGDALSLSPGLRFTDTVMCRDAGMIRDEQIDTFTSKGVHLLLYSQGAPNLEKDTGKALRYFPQRLAHRAAETIDAIFPEESAPLMRALLLGDKSALSEDHSTILSESGLFHITAVSGLHCSFLLALIGCFLPGMNRRYLGIAAIPLLVFYALMTGASPSVVRACIMLSLFLIAPIFYRESDSMTSLSAALLLILLGNPFAIKSISLQLSFAAVSGILLLTPRLQKKICALSGSKVLRFVLGAFAVTAGALLFTMPLCAYYFGVLPLVSPLSNLLCLSVTSVTFGAGLIAVVLGMIFPPAGAFLASIVHYGAAYILLAAKSLASLPHHAIYFENPYLKLWLAYAYLLFFGCWLLRKGKYRYVLASVCAAGMLCVTLTLYSASFHQGSACIVVGNVGQGQSIVLISGEESAVIDCGSANSSSVAGNLPVDIVYNAGHSRIDHLCLTHFDKDHMNGLERIAARIEIGEILVPRIEDENAALERIETIARSKDIPVRYIGEEDRFTVGQLEITAYPPLGSDSGNERGSCYLCSVGEFDLLVTGDIRTETEDELTKRYLLPDIEVLIAGHHGSKYAVGEALLSRTMPEVGIVSVGPNSYGHPTKEALSRMEAHGMSVYRTDRQGNIYITVGKG